MDGISIIITYRYNLQPNVALRSMNVALWVDERSFMGRWT